jgi:hypothetical protein
VIAFLALETGIPATQLLEEPEDMIYTMLDILEERAKAAEARS